MKKKKKKRTEQIETSGDTKKARVAVRRRMIESKSEIESEWECERRAWWSESVKLSPIESEWEWERKVWRGESEWDQRRLSESKVWAEEWRVRC